MSVLHGRSMGTSRRAKTALLAALTASLLLLLIWSPLNPVRYLQSTSARHCSCDNFPAQNWTYLSNMEQKLRSYVDLFSNAPYTFYPLYIPNFRGFVQQIIRGEAVDKKPIHTSVLTMGFPATPIYFDRQPVGLLILVKTAAGYAENRNIYRSIWANPEYLSSFNMPIAHAFLVGVGQFEGRLPPELHEESREHKDIIFQDFVESYRNNTYKTVGGLKWAVQEGPKFEFLVIIDDDLYFSVGAAVKLLRNPEMFYSVSSESGKKAYSKYGMKISPTESFLAGDAYSERPTYHIPYQFTWDEYPLETFPPYTSGMTTFFSATTAREIYEESHFVKMFHVDDAYIGLVAKKLGIRVTNIWPAVNPTDSHGNPPVEEGNNGVPVIAIHTYQNVTLRLELYNKVHSN